MNGQIGRRKSTASMPRCRGSPSVETRRTRSPSRSRTTASSPAAACGNGTCTSVRPGYRPRSATASSASRTGAPCGSRGRSEGEGGCRKCAPAMGGVLARVKGHGPRRRSVPVAPCAFPSKSRGASSLPVPPERSPAFLFLPSEVEPSRSSRAKPSLPAPPERSRAFPSLPSEAELSSRSSRAKSRDYFERQREPTSQPGPPANSRRRRPDPPRQSRSSLRRPRVDGVCRPGMRADLTGWSQARVWSRQRCCARPQPAVADMAAEWNRDAAGWSLPFV